MKLPENKKERIQVFVLIGVGVVLALYAIVQLGVMPLVQSRRNLKAAHDDLERKIMKAKVELDREPALREEFSKVTTELNGIIESNVLHPTLGSYLVGVTETVEQAAKQVGITVSAVQEVGIRDWPRSKVDKSAGVFKSYGVQMIGDASFMEVRAFLEKMETDNPFLCVTEVRIAGRPDKPDRHSVTVRMEWPIEAVPTDSATGGKEAQP